MDIIEIVINFFKYLNNFENKIFLIVIITFCSTFLFCLPIPSGISVFLIGMTFGIYGFFIAYFSLLLGAAITFIFMSKVIEKFFINYFIYKKFLNYSKKFKQNLYFIFISRLIIPFPIFSYIATILKIDFSKYILGTALGIIPGTFTIILISSRVKKSINSDEIIDFNVFRDPVFISSIILILILIFFTKKIKNKYFTN